MGNMCERELSEIWRRQRFAGELKSETGEALRVIYQGRRNDNRGGDFCDAIIAFPDRIEKGDVELHVRASDWRQHKHSADAHYNSVILHVVYSRGKQSATALENGTEVPILALAGYEKNWSDEMTSGRPCASAAANLGEALIRVFLERMGESRLNRKARAFGKQLKVDDPGQVLYEGMMYALGYSRNKEPFLTLSRKVRIKDLEQIAASADDERTCLTQIERVLRWASGLGAASPWEWVSPQCDAGHCLPMNSRDWQTFRMRPGNDPRARMAAMSHLLVRYRGEGLLQGMMSAVKKSPATSGQMHLREALQVQGGGRCSRPIALLGQERADDMVINVVLPFAVALGQAKGEGGLCRKARRLFAGWPSLGSNCIERHVVEQWRIPKAWATGAKRQQGLLEVYEQLCRQGKCRQCPLGKLESGQDIKIQGGAIACHEAEVPG